MAIADELGAPELQLLSDVLEGDITAALALATAPGGWRSLEADELRSLELHEHQIRVVTALQVLILRSWPSMPRQNLRSGGLLEARPGLRRPSW